LLLPSAIAGGVFVALCDLIARAIPSTTEVPLGVMTGLVGAPLFLALLLRARREEVVSGG
jgi:iron complex transport system permease protein